MSHIQEIGVSGDAKGDAGDEVDEEDTEDAGYVTPLSRTITNIETINKTIYENAQFQRFNSISYLRL